MFLFTTPPASAARDAQAVPRASAGVPDNPVVDAIRDGAARTGAGFDYLLATAQRESALDPKAKNPGSSATGLFQFIEQTWLGTMKSDGAKLGLGDYAAAISPRGDGGYTVGDASARQAILDLRKDPGVASAMAGALTQRNRETLVNDLGREPTKGELYAAHVLGARGASDLIRTAGANPSRTAASDFPEAAAANRSIFYDKTGRARGASEVVGVLSAGQAVTQAQTTAAAPDTAAPSFGPGRPLAYARNDGPVMHALFQTDVRRGPISEGVAKLWQTRATPPTAEKALAYFPRSDGSADTTETASVETPAPVADQATTAMTTAPLPPRRPDDLVGALPRTQPGAGAIRAAGSGGTVPLDLAAYMRPRR